MKTRSEKELYKKIDMWEKKLKTASYMLGRIIDGREYIGDLCENISHIIDYVNDATNDVKSDYQEYHDIPKKYYDLASDLYSFTSLYIDGIYRPGELKLRGVGEFACNLYDSVEDLLHELREEF